MSRLWRILQRLLFSLAHLLPLGLKRHALGVAYRPTRLGLKAARKRPQQTQWQSLKQILDANRLTEFGQSHGFAQIRDEGDFSRRVPLRGKSEMDSYLRREEKQGGVLVAETPLGFVCESDPLRDPPQRLPIGHKQLELWQEYDKLLRWTALEMVPRTARGEWLRILPHYQLAQSDSGKPTAPWPILQQLLDPELATTIPHEVFAIADENARYYFILRLSLDKPITALWALAPGTLTILASQLQRQASQLIDDLGAGKFRYQEFLPQACVDKITQLPADPMRADELRNKLQKRGVLRPLDCWPHLSLLCCPTSGHSRSAAQKLADRYGTLPVLHPGLAAISGPLTHCWAEGMGGELILQGNYVEFLADGSEVTRKPTELEEGARYQPILTNFAGLYRYALPHLMQVMQRRGTIPRLSRTGSPHASVAFGDALIDEGAVVASCEKALEGLSNEIAEHRCWLEEAVAQRQDSVGPKTDGADDRQPWYRRVLGRLSEEAPQRRHNDLPALCWAIEAADPLPSQQAQHLVDALEEELKHQCRTYYQLREATLLASCRMLLLRPGTFERLQRERVSLGLPLAHAPLPGLLMRSPSFEDGEVLERIG